MCDPADIERGAAAFARYANGGMVVTASTSAVVNREVIIALAAQHKIPTVYYERLFAASGGLISYGPSFRDINRRAASYVDRILKGEKPADLPVQAPDRYELLLRCMSLLLAQSGGPGSWRARRVARARGRRR